MKEVIGNLSFVLTFTGIAFLFFGLLSTAFFIEGKIFLSNPLLLFGLAILFTILGLLGQFFAWSEE